MKALVYKGTEDTAIMDWADPAPGPDEVLVAVSHSGICGSDMHAWHGHDARRVPPMILGHEASGTILGGPRDGERVTINPLVSCGECSHCTAGDVHLCEQRTLLGMGYPGAYAEQIAVRSARALPLQAGTSFATAALTEPLACAVHGVKLALPVLRKAPADTDVVVLGGGAIGLLAALVFAEYGFSRVRIAETNDTRRRMLGDCLAATPYDPINAPAHDSSADLVFDAVGSGRTRAAASAMVRPGGTIIHIGLQDGAEGLDTRRITLQEIAFIGTYCYRDADFVEALSLLESGRISGEGWTEYRPLDAGPQSFHDIDQGKAPPKIILQV